MYEHIHTYRLFNLLNSFFKLLALYIISFWNGNGIRTWQRQRERQRETERDRERQRETERDRERQRGREREREVKEKEKA